MVKSIKSGRTSKGADGSPRGADAGRSAPIVERANAVGANEMYASIVSAAIQAAEADMQKLVEGNKLGGRVQTKYKETMQQIHAANKQAKQDRMETHAFFKEARDRIQRKEAKWSGTCVQAREALSQHVKATAAAREGVLAAAGERMASLQKAFDREVDKILGGITVASALAAQGGARAK